MDVDKKQKNITEIEQKPDESKDELNNHKKYIPSVSPPVAGNDTRDKWS